MTLPGIAGIILAIGMGVDANVITAERIKEELKNGKSLDGALKSGFARGLTPIIDGNVTIVIVAIVLMGAFGPSDGMFAKALHFVFFAFGPSTAGTIYAFGYTLLTGVLLNFVFGVFATRVMIRGAASIKALRNPWLYGAAKARQGKDREEAHQLCGPAQEVPDDLLLPDGSHRAVRCGFGCPSGYRVHRRCHDHPELRGQLYHVGCAEGCILGTGWANPA